MNADWLIVMSSLTPGLILTIFGVSVTFVYLALVMGFLGVKKNKFPVNGRVRLYLDSTTLFTHINGRFDRP